MLDFTHSSPRHIFPLSLSLFVSRSSRHFNVYYIDNESINQSFVRKQSVIWKGVVRSNGGILLITEGQMQVRL
jgi:hypothetical protein